MKNLITQTSMDMILNHNIRLLQYFQKLAAMDDNECSHYDLNLKRSMPDVMNFLVKFSSVDAEVMANSTACLFELRPQTGVASVEELSPATDSYKIIQEHINFCNSLVLCYHSIMELNNDTFLFSENNSSNDHLFRYLKLVFGDIFTEHYRAGLSTGRLKLENDSVMFFPRFNTTAICEDERFSFQTKFRLLSSLLSNQTKDQEVLTV